jgi:aspartyl-tRNA(Asn)/glutamyl-tRNA(Gln) amidotransferase subunit A
MPSISQRVDSVANKGIKASEIAKRAMKRIKDSALPTNSFISLCKPDISKSERLRSLEGAIFSVKDNINVAHEVTTCGSKILKNNIAQNDADIVRLLKDAGAICIGKNNMHEFALGATSLNPHYGDVSNPWDLSKISGGSSGGSATAVATGEVDFSVGTDSGGSVRIPASMCGVVGFKPTGGLLSLYGLEGAAWTIDNYGIFARSVSDVELVWKNLCPSDLQKPEKKGTVRLGYIQDESMGMVSREVWAVFQDRIGKLKKAGCELEGISLNGLEMACFVCTAIAYPEVSSQHAKWIREQPENYGDDIRPLIQLGEILSARHYVTAQRTRSLLYNRYLTQTKGFDAVLTPTIAVSPPKKGETAVVSGDTSEHTLFTLMRFTVLFNAIGFPAISIPAGLDVKGMPVGMQVIGYPYRDTDLLELSRNLEEILGSIGESPVRLE